MRPDALEAAIRRDRQAGALPCAISATVGTTSTSSVDPVRAIAAIAAREKVWLHVDAAYAGSATIVPEYRWLWDGIEAADSIVVNPHKWLFTPIDCSAFYTRHPAVLKRAFSLVPEYLVTRDQAEVVNLMAYGVQLGRRFRALKLWFLIRAFGAQGRPARSEHPPVSAPAGASRVSQGPNGWECRQGRGTAGTAASSRQAPGQYPGTFRCRYLPARPTPPAPGHRAPAP